MKKAITIGLLSLAAVVACQKTENEIVAYDETKFCIVRQYDAPSKTLVSQAIQDTVKPLFLKNNMPFEKYKIIDFIKIDTATRYHYEVECAQFVNNQKLFHYEVMHNFKKDGTFLNTSGTVIAKIDLDTLPSMSEKAVVKRYFDEINAVSFTIDFKKAIIENCVELEFGYYRNNKDLDNPTFTKAWRVNSVKSKSSVSYIDDSNAKLLEFMSSELVIK